VKSIGTLISEASQVLRSSGVPNSRQDAGLLLADILDVERTFIISHPETVVANSAVIQFEEAIKRRAAGEPVQYITGKQEFYKLLFRVTRDVLIPRPETEVLVEQALSFQPISGSSPLICDVGTGSGCILISLLHERRLATGIGIDISERALIVARDNADRHQVLGRGAFLVGDCFDAVVQQPVFDLVVSNPPYVAADSLSGLQREVRDYEPQIALSPGGAGLSVIFKLLMQSARVLKTGGHLLIEIGFDQQEVVVREINSRVWKLLDVLEDLQGIPRTVVLQKL
jgi:release factor glutamine methyltransferase